MPLALILRNKYAPLYRREDPQFSMEGERMDLLATLLYADWVPQVNGPTGALLSNFVDHRCAVIVLS